jgi:hypothetical protein
MKQKAWGQEIEPGERRQEHDVESSETGDIVRGQETGA